jgi:uncharacterized protein (TIRG00374 family)
MSADQPKRRVPWGWIIAIGLAAILLYFALRNVDWNEALETARGGRVEYLILAAAALALSYFFRSLRWRVLLSADKPLHPLTTYWGIWVGYLGNSVLPARAGELLRSVMIGRKAEINIGFALATTLTERIIDAGVLVLIALVSISALADVPETLLIGARTMAVVAVVGIAGVLIAPRLEKPLLAALAWLLDKLPLPSGLSAKIDQFAARFLNGMRALQHPGRAAGFAVWTAGAWAVDVVVAWCVGMAFGIALTAPQIALLLAALGLASAAPSTPGYVGIYQAVAVSVLTPFGYTDSQAIVFIIAFQAVSYTMVIAFGALGLWRLNTGGLRLSEAIAEGKRSSL